MTTKASFRTKMKKLSASTGPTMLKSTAPSFGESKTVNGTKYYRAQFWCPICKKVDGTAWCETDLEIICLRCDTRISLYGEVNNSADVEAIRNMPNPNEPVLLVPPSLVPAALKLLSSKPPPIPKVGNHNPFVMPKTLEEKVQMAVDKQVKLLGRI